VLAMIEYYIDGSKKDNVVGAGIVKVDQFGFIEKHHYYAEHTNASSTVAEGYSLEKTFELIKKMDTNPNELINIYTDCQKLQQTFLFNEKIEFTRNNFFAKQESHKYFQHLRNIYLELISRSSDYPIYHCDKTKEARPLIKIYFKDDAEEKKYLQVAHSLSRTYIKEEEAKPFIIELKATRKMNKWYIVKDNNTILAENKRPLIALSEALKQTDAKVTEIKLCPSLETILKSTNKKNLSTPMRSAVKIIENHKSLIGH
jgi:ribonuclease HI